MQIIRESMKPEILFRTHHPKDLDERFRMRDEETVKNDAKEADARPNSPGKKPGFSLETQKENIKGERGKNHLRADASENFRNSKVQSR